MSNLIPKGWGVVELIKLSTKIGDGIHSTPKYIDFSPYPFINGNNLISGRIIVGDKAKFVSESEYIKYKKDLNDKTILMSINGTIGKLAYYQGENVVLGKSAAFISLKPEVSQKFIYYTLQSDYIRTFYDLELTGSTIKNLSLRAIRETPVFTPPLPEQQKIAKILTSVDEVIEKTQAQIDKLKDLKTGMMQELLTNGIGHTEFKDSPIGRIPAEWSVLKISELCSHVVDCVNKTAPVVDFKTPYKMIRTTNVRHGRVDTENVRCVTKETFELWTRRLLPENGDLIFTREAPVGECGILKDSRGVFLGQRTMMYRASKAKTSAEFLMYSIMSDYGKQQLEDFSGGSTVGHMRVPDCGKILIKTPPIDEQAKIVKSLGSVDTSILIKEKKLAKINHSKKALMQDLLTGKVRVKVDSK
jgi:type I restriction enzyme S subunit